MQKHEWFKLTSKRTQPYTIDDVSVIIPSTAERFKKRMEWFWEQYVEKTQDRTIENTIIPCDPEEVDHLKRITGGKAKLVPTSPRWIVTKTIAALEEITTRLTFRLANDIMIVREGWEDLLIKQFNAEEKLQIIAELQHGQAFPSELESLGSDWDYIKREYRKPPTAAEYPHGARLFAQTSVFRGYYEPVLRYTPHDHDEIFFSQLARGDGITFTNFRGINLYLAHVGITNQDFTEEYIKTHIHERRQQLSDAPDRHTFTVVP